MYWNLKSHHRRTVKHSIGIYWRRYTDLKDKDTFWIIFHGHKVQLKTNKTIQYYHFCHFNPPIWLFNVNHLLQLEIIIGVVRSKGPKSERNTLFLSLIWLDEYSRNRLRRNVPGTKRCPLVTSFRETAPEIWGTKPQSGILPWFHRV